MNRPRSRHKSLAKLSLSLKVPNSRLTEFSGLKQLGKSFVKDVWNKTPTCNLSPSPFPGVSPDTSANNPLTIPSTDP